MSEENQTNEQAQTPEQLVESVLNQMDLNEVTPQAVFQDIIMQTKLHSMRLMVAVALFERLAAKQSAEPTSEQPEQASKESPATPDLKVVEDQA